MSVSTNVSITRKHPRDEESLIDQRPFTIRDPDRPLASPQTFRPVCLLPRARLSLAFLDTSRSGSRLFSAHIYCLESWDDFERDAVVLIAANEGILYAIEQVQKTCYALCKLKAAITEDMLEDGIGSGALTSIPRPVKRRALETSTTSSPKGWWAAAAVDQPDGSTSSTYPARPLPEIRMRTTATTSKQRSEPPQAGVAAVAPEPTTNVLPDAISRGQTLLHNLDTFEELARQYLDALYISRTSLAYFTKGPLARARVAVTTENSSQTLVELTSFLRGSILTALVMDKKYREHIPKTVKDLPVLQVDSPEQATGKNKKKKLKWKAKRTKLGFFITEQEFVERWWHRGDEPGESPSSTETVDESIRRRCAKIRNRETFLQIILVLEALALEAATPAAPVENCIGASAAVESQNAENEDPEASAKKSKVKKAQDLSAHLEALLDKLCIWQSLESHSPAKKREGDPAAEHEQPNDELRSFCVEVVVPFFNSRIPKYVSLINKKLGGPSAPSPAKRAPAQNGESGCTAKRNVSSKAARPAPQKTASDNLKGSGSSRPMSRSRTSTDSINFPSIKREGSEISLKSIPELTAVPPYRRSTSVMPQLQQFSKREVDLTAVSATTEAKVRRKRDVEIKLKEAVEMLKKPNRALAVQDDATRVDERFVKATAGKPKPKSNPPRSRDSDTMAELQVTSTPSHSRTVKATPYRTSYASRQETASSKESRTTHIPSSTLRPGPLFSMPAPMSTPSVSRMTQRTQPENSIQETPSRGFAKFMPVGLARMPGTLETPSVTRALTIIQQSPSKPMRPLVEASPNAPRLEARGTDASIYDALGWGHDSYEQLE